MTQTTFTDNVLVDGSQDTTQLRVQGHTTQLQPLQTWENSAGTPQARVSGDGNLQVGDDLLGWSTPDALMEVHRAEASTAKPKRGFHSLGQVSGTLNALVQWIVGELELRGSTAIDALHTALRIRATNMNTGTPTANAELRGADIEVINDASAGAAALTKATGLQVGVTNASGKTISEAVGVRVKMPTSGITNPYSIYVEGRGVAHFEDSLETKYPSTVPGTPAADFLRIYGKADGKLYAKNWSGQEFDLTGGGGGGAARNRSGLQITRIDNATLCVGLGEVAVGETPVEKTTQTNLGMATGADWIGGASNEAASAFANVYLDATGNLKLHNKFPNYPRPDTASRVFTALVNQAGWNGTAGLGLNATSVVYDNDTGESNLKPGMLLGIYGSGDTDYSQGRGKGSGAGAGVQHSSWALITAVNTGTNTLTLAAGHQIAINDNDRLIVVEAGAILYRNESSTWYRWLGAIYNDASSNLSDKEDSRAAYLANESVDYTNNSTSFQDIDSTKFNFDLVCFEPLQIVEVGWHGTFFLPSGSLSAAVYLNVAVDGALIAGEDGLYHKLATFGPGATSLYWWSPLAFNVPVPLLPGTHNFKMKWKNRTTGTTILYAGAGTSLHDVHPEFWVERKDRYVN